MVLLRSLCVCVCWFFFVCDNVFFLPRKNRMNHHYLFSSVALLVRTPMYVSTYQHKDRCTLRTYHWYYFGYRYTRLWLVRARTIDRFRHSMLSFCRPFLAGTKQWSDTPTHCLFPQALPNDSTVYADKNAVWCNDWCFNNNEIRVHGIPVSTSNNGCDYIDQQWWLPCFCVYILLIMQAKNTKVFLLVLCRTTTSTTTTR